MGRDRRARPPTYTSGSCRRRTTRHNSDGSPAGPRVPGRTQRRAVATWRSRVPHGMPRIAQRRSESLVLVLDGPAGATMVDALCDRMAIALTHTSADVVVCDIASPTEANVALVNALARMQLTARRLGRSITVRHACPEVRHLLDLLGLTDFSMPRRPRKEVDEHLER